MQSQRARNRGQGPLTTDELEEGWHFCDWSLSHLLLGGNPCRGSKARGLGARILKPIITLSSCGTPGTIPCASVSSSVSRENNSTNLRGSLRALKELVLIKSLETTPGIQYALSMC